MTVAIGGREIGPGAPVLVIAEAGVNHDGDPAKALALINAAADAGADAVKFQTFDTAALAAADAPLAAYQADRATGHADQVAMLRALELPEPAWAALAEHAAKRGILFLSTPFDTASAMLLERLGVPAFKLGSGELTNLPFLRELALRGLPLLVSTGMATLEEVRDAADAVAGCPLVILHCVSSYPAPEAEANLRAMDTLRAAFPLVPVGWSDHCLDDDVTVAAVARDACVIERHLTLDRSAPGPDHAMSMEPGALAALIRRIRVVESALGTGEKVPQPSEADTARVARRSIVAARDLSAGDTLDRTVLQVKRPATGLSPARLEQVVGAKLAKAIRRDEPLTEDHIA